MTFESTHIAGRRTLVRYMDFLSRRKERAEVQKLNNLVNDIDLLLNNLDFMYRKFFELEEDAKRHVWSCTLAIFAWKRELSDTKKIPENKSNLLNISFRQERGTWRSCV